MHLYFLRHGHAEPGGLISDHDRQLTPEGIQRLHVAAKVMRQLNINPAHIFSSPRIRARQTADIIAEATGTPVEIREEVNFDFDLNAVRTLIQDLPATDEVMFVGHEPTFSMTVQNLTGADVEMKKGGLARVDLYDPRSPRGMLVWLIAPKVFDALDGA